MKDQIFNAFNQIHAEEALIEKTLEGMYSYREKRSRRAFFSQRGMALAVSFAMMLCIGVTGWQSYFTQAFALTVDVNPSIEMTVNHFDRVISAKGFNAEGLEVISAVNVKHMNYADAVDCLLEEQKREGFLEDDGTVLVAVACPKEKKAAQVKEVIDTAQAETSQTVAVVQPEKAVVVEAEKHDMSFGKYQAYLDIQEVEPAVTTEEVKEMSVQEIASIVSDTTQTGSAIAAAGGSQSSSSHTKEPVSAPVDASTSASTSNPGKDTGTNANTSASPNAGTNANTSATPNSSTNSSSGGSDKKPVTNSNNGTDSSTDKKPADTGNKDNASDKKPTGTTDKDNASDKKPAGTTDKDDTSVKDPVGETTPAPVPETVPGDNAESSDVNVENNHVEDEGIEPEATENLAP